MPPPPARQGFAWKMSHADIKFNQNIYKAIREKYDNNLKKISSIQEITNNNLWPKMMRLLIVKDVSLRQSMMM